MLSVVALTNAILTQQGTFSRSGMAVSQEESPSFRAGRMSTKGESFKVKEYERLKLEECHPSYVDANEILNTPTIHSKNRIADSLPYALLLLLTPKQ